MLRFGILCFALHLILPGWAAPLLGQTRTPVAKTDSKAAEEPPEDKAQRWRPGLATAFEVSIPHPLSLGVGYVHPKGGTHMLDFGYVAKSLEGSYNIHDIKVQMMHIEYYYRNEPWERHPLFFQVAVGAQQFQLDGARTVSFSQDELNFTTDIQGRLLIRSLYWTPKMGITKHFMSGVTLSWGFGYMIPALVQSEFTSRVQDDPLVEELLQQIGSYQATQEDLRRLGKRLGQVGIPHIDLFDLIWRF